MRLDIGFLIMPTPRANNPVAAMTTANRILLQACQDHDLTAWFVDHFQFGKQPYLECLTQMAFSAGRYPGIRTGTLVLGQGYRNPALTAKAAATLAYLNPNGLILGIGAGWKEDEYLAYGYPFPTAGQRLDELEEAVQIIDGLWTNESFTFDGRYHKVQDAICEPRPDPKPIMMIGGKGEKRTLRIAARYGDWWNADYIWPDEFRRKVGILRDHCEEIGRDPNSIAKTYFGMVSVSKDPDQVARVLPPNYPPDAYMLNGDPEEVLAKIMEFREIGAQHMQLVFLDYPQTAGIELFLSDVLPRIKEMT